MNEFESVGVGNYNFIQALTVSVLTLPQQFYQFFPMAGLVGCLAGLGLLASHSELIVMRTAGMSVGQITLAVMRAALIVIIFATFVGEVIAPITLHIANDRKAVAMSGGQAIQTQHGNWLRQGHNFIYIATVYPHHHLKGVLWFTLGNKQRLRSIGYAKSADFIKGDRGC